MVLDENEEFKDFDYSSSNERAKKASQALLSINDDTGDRELAINTNSHYEESELFVNGGGSIN